MLLFPQNSKEFMLNIAKKYYFPYRYNLSEHLLQDIKHQDRWE